MIGLMLRLSLSILFALVLSTAFFKSAQEDLFVFSETAPTVEQVIDPTVIFLSVKTQLNLLTSVANHEISEKDLSFISSIDLEESHSHHCVYLPNPPPLKA